RVIAPPWPGLPASTMVDDETKDAMIRFGRYDTAVRRAICHHDAGPPAADTTRRPKSRLPSDVPHLPSRMKKYAAFSRKFHRPDPRPVPAIAATAAPIADRPLI